MKFSPWTRRVLWLGLFAVAAAVVLGVLFLNRSAGAAVERMERQRQAERREHLRDLKKTLAEGPDPFARQIGIFISTDVINEALSVFEGFEQEFPKRPDLALKINSVRCEFVDATPEIALGATLREKRRGLSVEVAGRAYLHLTTDGNDGGALKVEVRVVDLVSKARWSWLQFGLGGLLEEYLKIEAADRLLDLPSIELPLTRSIATEVPASKRIIKIPAEGRLEAALSFPRAAVAFNLRLTNTLILNNGAYLAFDLK